jgi:hypothetical protein
MYSSGPPDLAGVFRRMDGESDDIEKAALTYDATNLNRVPVSAIGSAKDKKKGDKPQDKDQKKWAPLHYFVPVVAGSLVAMTNKLGSWNMGLSPGIKVVSSHMFDIVRERLTCLISEYDMNNSSRYFFFEFRRFQNRAFRLPLFLTQVLRELFVQVCRGHDLQDDVFEHDVVGKSLRRGLQYNARVVLRCIGHLSSPVSPRPPDTEGGTIRTHPRHGYDWLKHQRARRFDTIDQTVFRWTVHRGQEGLHTTSQLYFVLLGQEDVHE